MIYSIFKSVLGGALLHEMVTREESHRNNQKHKHNIIKIKHPSSDKVHVNVGVQSFEHVASQALNSA